jgi:hypothetical protein
MNKIQQIGRLHTMTNSSGSYARIQNKIEPNLRTRMHLAFRWFPCDEVHVLIIGSMNDKSNN